jgi:hypothetical protein
MKDISTLVSGIEYKIGKVIGRQEILEKEILSLKTVLIEKSKIIDNQKDEIKKLEEKNRILILAKTLEATEGNVEAKRKINELVREIDRCIGLLNT